MDDLTFAWPFDIWPDWFWSEVWPDYGTNDPEPPATIIPLVMHHLKQQGVG
jgi:hypothetical protein